ncbi:MAG TPA: Ig-like domain-containing protein [Candidatus Margulisiibacteriota bacterium]|nr:Ig-like domain-containing protein [Candidatus Margulisiibacteriota bacterium]
MTHRRMRRVLCPLGVVLTLLLPACGDSNGSPAPALTATATRTATLAAPQPTPTHTATRLPHPSPQPTQTQTPAPTATASVTPTTSTASVTGLIVVNHAVVSAAGDNLGTAPPEWSAGTDKASFDRSLAFADWAVPEVNKEGQTAADGRFSITGLPPGRYSFQVTKTLDGNLATLSFPFSVGDDGTADVVAEVSWGLVRAVSTYTHAGVRLQEMRGPYGTSLVTTGGRVTEIADPSRTLVDPDGDGSFTTLGCDDRVWECGSERDCGNDHVCSCTASCPFCDNCGPPVCVDPGSGSQAPYPCDANDTCSQAGDRCLCVSSCPDCKDCTRKVCVPACVPVTIAAIQVVNGPSQLVVGEQGSVSAVAKLSDGSQIDVTYLATWRSSDDTVATVDSWGQVVAHAVGTAALTATVGTISSVPWSVGVVTRPTLQRIDVENVSCFYPLGLPVDFGSRPPVEAPPTSGILPPSPTCGLVVQIGKTIQFRAVGQFANGYYQDITDEVQWQLTPPGIGEVPGGAFTAQHAGSTTLTASLDAVVSDGTDIRVVAEPTITALSIYADSGIIAFVDDNPQRVDVAIPCPVTSAGSVCCCPGPLADATLSPCNCGYTITVLRGDRVKFRATAQYDTGEFRDVTNEVTWRSTNTAAATIDAQGVMTAVETGDATIDAVLGTVSSNTVGVHVVNQATLQSLYIYQDGTDRVVARGDQRFFKATGNYDIGFGRDVTTVATWRSSDDSIGGFDTPGVFTARAAGMVQVWAELDGKQSDRISLEVYETSDITYCDPAHVNRAVWSDNFNLVTLESDCGEYRQPGVAALRYTVAELQPHGGVFDPCLDLYVYQGSKRVRTIREEGCGDPFVAATAPGRDEAVLKYQLRAFWDLKGDDGQPVAPGTYTIYGRFYLYFDPVVSIDVDVLPADGTLPTRTPTPTVGPVCTPPLCRDGEVPVCPGDCPGGCGSVCGIPTPTPTPEGFCFRGAGCSGTGYATSRSDCCLISRLSASPMPFSWCPTGDHDPTTDECAVCAADPCSGLPPATASPS